MKITGLGLNQLSKLDTSIETSQCGWNHMIGTQIDGNNDKQEFDFYFGDECIGDNDWCTAHIVGEMYFSFVIIALLLNILATFGMFCRKNRSINSTINPGCTRKCKYFFMLSSFLLFLSIFIWVIDNPLCFATSKEWKLGASSILILVAGFIQIIAGYFSMKEMQTGYISYDTLIDTNTSTNNITYDRLGSQIEL